MLKKFRLNNVLKELLTQLIYIYVLISEKFDDFCFK